MNSNNSSCIFSIRSCLFTKTWRVAGISNCSDFQARRLNIRIKTESATTPVATLNGTLVAIPRMIVAILENHQQSDGSVILPKVLQGLLGMERFTPVAN